ncbi:MAG: class I SAM-dependent methyltransferase [SAR324 cluster bacterium]|nr:class I SAM-dependent methyltransferase [SAR324 cluster bacterium]
MNDRAEKKVSDFYKNQGWEKEGEDTEDAIRWEDLRENSQEYLQKCRMRIYEHIPKAGQYILDMASGPIQYPEYLEYSKNFEKRYCVDLSEKALEGAKKKLGERGEYLCGSFFDLELEENFFDCSISLHTIYHMDKEKQAEAVRKLIKVTKVGKPVIIIYSNPDTLVSKLSFPIKLIRGIKNLVTKKIEPDLYFFAHPIRWWRQFDDEAEVEILPWRSLAANIQKLIVPDNKLGKSILRETFKVEEKYPNFFVKNFQYPMIILTKKG